MDDFFNTPLSAFGDFLEHHGIKGQKWGVRNAEWYPIDAYRKAKGIVVDAANSETAKTVKKKTVAAVEKTGEVAKKAAKKAGEAYAEGKEKHKQKKAVRKERQAVKAQVKEERRKEVAEAEKKRILNTGTPREVLRISDQLTNDELAYAKNRNDLLKQLRELDSKQVKYVREKQLRKKWGKLMNTGDALKTLSQPIEDVATALERVNRLKKAVGGSAGEKKESNENKGSGKKKNQQSNTNIGSMPNSGFSKSEKSYMMNMAKNADTYNIDFLETVQNDIVSRKGGKSLQKEYSKFLDDPGKYMSSFKESSYQKTYKNRPEVREAMRIAKADGWQALTNHQKELLSELD